ncbi:MAG: hypothetical protein NTU53_02795 [Planctomycetota bacterium]|nr:hypothetical protein [Planctomycetota bacterium]
MTYRGHIKNGVVVLDEPAELPEGAEVKVELDPPKPAEPPIGQKLMRWAGVLKSLPPDASRNIDHYLYGHPKR